ncbi:MAG: hypothetical protein WBD24_00745 [Candidatus Omnitrophota bacterium]
MSGKNIDDKIVLGVLLWATGAVAEADDKFLPEESEEIKRILSAHLDFSEEDFADIKREVVDE